jgi:hypothetical protein
MGERTSLLIAVLAFLAAGCGGGTPAGPSSTSAPETASQTAAEQPAAASDEPGCTFSQGVTTCVTTTQSIVTSTHTEVSGCMASNGTTFVPGRRERTFQDRVQVTQTTTTLRHGRNGKTFDTQTTSQSQPLSSTLVSDICVPI